MTPLQWTLYGAVVVFMFVLWQLANRAAWKAERMASQAEAARDSAIAAYNRMIVLTNAVSKSSVGGNQT